MTIAEIKEEMLKVKIPWFIKSIETYWFKLGRFLIIASLVLFVPLMILADKINIQHVDTVWGFLYGLMGFVAFNGLTMLLTHLIKDDFVRKQAKRLGISEYQWNMYTKELGLKTYIK